MIVICVVIFVVCDGRGIYLIYLVNWFIIVRVSGFFFGVFGNGLRNYDVFVLLVFMYEI